MPDFQAELAAMFAASQREDDQEVLAQLSVMARRMALQQTVREVGLAMMEHLRPLDYTLPEDYAYDVMRHTMAVVRGLQEAVEQLDQEGGATGDAPRADA